MTLNFTKDYDTWLQTVQMMENIVFTGEKRVFILFDEFKNLNGYMLAPSGTTDTDIMVMAKTWKFNTQEEVLDFISKFNNFILYRCIKCERNDKEHYELRGALL